MATDNATLIAAIMAKRENSRLALATALVERNNEAQMLRSANHDIERYKRELERTEAMFIACNEELAEAKRLVEVHKTEAHNLRLKQRGRTDDAPAPAAAQCTCTKCNGTGLYTANVGNLSSPDEAGICYACEGKGFLTEADKRRNWGYAKFRQATVRDAVTHNAPAVMPKKHNPTVAATQRAEALKAYFAAHPGARSVSPAQLEEFSHAPA